MAHPLEGSYQWRTPVLFASLGAVVCLGLLARSRVPGWVEVAGVLVSLWAILIGLAFVRTRASLMVDGDRLTVRRFRTFHTIAGADVTRVAQFATPTGPSYRLTVRRADGRSRRLVAPVSLLRRGHPTLFAWILAYAPQAELDARSHKTLSRLQERGLVP